MYRYIEDQKIIGGPQALPTNWRDKGDISARTPEQLKAEGWLPNAVVDERVEGEVDAGWTDVLEADRVVQTLHSKPAPPVDAAALQSEIVSRVQDRLDAFAQTRGYDDITSACTYAGCAVPKFATEGSYCRDVRALTWASLYGVLAQVQAGNWPTSGAGQMPRSYEDVEASLPALEWPT